MSKERSDKASYKDWELLAYTWYPKPRASLDDLEGIDRKQETENGVLGILVYIGGGKKESAIRDKREELGG